MISEEEYLEYLKRFGQWINEGAELFTSMTVAVTRVMPSKNETKPRTDRFTLSKEALERAKKRNQ